MVLEQLWKPQWMEKKEHSFILGFIYTIIGILSAKLIIPSYAGAMSIAFTSILLVPSLNTLLREEENIEVREKKLHLGLLFKDHIDIIKTYLYLFLGIFSAYLLIAMMLPQGITELLFTEQLTITGLIGKATASQDLFVQIILNNMLVFIVCFILSLIYGAGSILFLTINASAWGSFFGYVARDSGASLSAFATVILPVLPHTVTEALSYVFAAIVGGVVSKAVLREKIFSKKFNHILTDAGLLLTIGLLLVYIAGFLEVFVL
jgi:uncharacterized membrane protein SpoIIM required for sporulation